MPASGGLAPEIGCCKRVNHSPKAGSHHGTTISLAANTQGRPPGRGQILRNGGHTIGLFPGDVREEHLAFNPGWDSQEQLLEGFTDGCELRRRLRAKGVMLVNEEGMEPADFVAVDLRGAGAGGPAR